MKTLLAAAIVACLALTACDITPPHLPNWDVELTVPLVNQKFFVSDLADSTQIVVGENQILTITRSGSLVSPPFGDVNFTPEIYAEDVPLPSGTELDLTFPLADPTGTVFASYGHFIQGVIYYMLDLDDPANAQVTLTFPDIQNDAGVPLTITSNANPDWQSVSLVGYHAGVRDSGVILEGLRVLLSIQSDQPDDTVIGTGGIRLNNQLGFDEFQGYLYDYIRTFDGSLSVVEINYPFELEDVLELQNASVKLYVTNETGFDAEFYGKIKAVNTRTGEERIVDIFDDQGQPFHVDAAEASGPVTTQMVFSSQVFQAMQIMPDRVELIEGYLLINGGHGSSPGFVDEFDRFYCDYQINVPLEMIVYDYEFDIDEPMEFEVTDELRQTLSERLIEARLTAGIVNRVPLGFTATAYLGTSPVIDPNDPLTYAYSKTLTLHSSQYVGPDVDAQGQQIVQFGLNEQELQIFQNPFVYIYWSFRLEPSNGPITIYASPADYIQIRCLLTVRVKVQGAA